MKPILRQSSSVTRLLDQHSQMQRMLKPFALKSASMFDSIKLPSLALQKQIDDTLKPLMVLSESVATGMLPLIEQLTQVQSVMRPMLLRNESFLAIHQLPTFSFQRKLHDALRPVADLQLNIWASLQPMIQQQVKMHEAFEPLLLKLSNLSFEDLHTGVAEWSKFETDELSVEYVDQDEKGYIVSGEFVSVQDIQSDLAVVLEKQSNLDTRLDDISFEIKKLNPAKQAIIIGLILGFFFFFLSTYNPLDKKVDLKEVKKSVSQIELTNEQKKHYRYVYVKTVLNVREKGYVHSDVIDNLSPGTIVILVQKEKNWSYISYTEPFSGEQKNGWVFSRYLKRFG